MAAFLVMYTSYKKLSDATGEYLDAADDYLGWVGR